MFGWPYVCFCGLVEVAGTAQDEAKCMDCDWTAKGIASEHLATHHHQRTQHNWKLLWEGTPI